MLENRERWGCDKSKYVSKAGAARTFPIHVNRLAQRPRPREQFWSFRVVGLYLLKESTAEVVDISYSQRNSIKMRDGSPHTDIRLLSSLEALDLVDF